MSAFLYRSTRFDPYENLAVEEALLGAVGKEDCILYLWQNEPTVVIGRNQNPWKECDLGRMAADGVHLARRSSGGGAVYHDRGNLNYSFLAGGAVYDVRRQTRVVQAALDSLGIRTERTGRNDLTAAGRKFSGNAYLVKKDRACQHGTLMVDVELTALSSYLSPSRAKLAANGVDSVRARVVNLRELVPTLTCAQLADALEQAFAKEYGNVALLETLPCNAGEAPQCANRSGVVLSDSVRRLTARNVSDAWLYGARFTATFTAEGRFPWGGIELQFVITGNRITACRVYTDALDETLAPRIEQALTGLSTKKEDLAAALTFFPQGAEIFSILKEAFYV